MVEIGGVVGDAVEGPGQLGLAEDFAFLVEVAIALKDAFGLSKGREVRIGELMSFFVAQDRSAPVMSWRGTRTRNV